MANHSLIKTDIVQKGVFIDAVVTDAARVFAGINATGLIDTGSDHVLVSRSIAKHVKLRRVGDEPLGAIGGTIVMGTLCSACIRIPKLHFEKVLPVYAVDWDQTSHTVLLGRSFLKHFVFRYDGPSEVFGFSHPVD